MDKSVSPSLWLSPALRPDPGFGGPILLLAHTRAQSLPRRTGSDGGSAVLRRGAGGGLARRRRRRAHGGVAYNDDQNVIRSMAGSLLDKFEERELQFLPKVEKIFDKSMSEPFVYALYFLYICLLEKKSKRGGSDGSDGCCAHRYSRDAAIPELEKGTYDEEQSKSFEVSSTKKKSEAMAS